MSVAWIADDGIPTGCLHLAEENPWRLAEPWRSITRCGKSKGGWVQPWWWGGNGDKRRPSRTLHRADSAAAAPDLPRCRGCLRLSRLRGLEIGDFLRAGDLVGSEVALLQRRLFAIERRMGWVAEMEMEAADLRLALHALRRREGSRAADTA